jgi:uncharacterized repeat protein (TIGR02059 family)
MKKAIFSVLILFAFLFNTKAQDYSKYTKCAEQDSLALVAFYNATDGPNWISNQDGFSVSQLSDNVLTYHTIDYPNAGMGKWLQGPVKNWFGVLLEKQQIGNTQDSVWRVVHVRPTISRRQAGDDKLKGYVPREVGLLTALKWFKVNGNGGLTGTELPKELWHPTLEALDIEAAYFAGELSKEIRKCTKLSQLNFRYNLLDSVPVFDFLSPDFILNHYNGNAFYFYNNRLSYTNIEASVEYFFTFSNPKQIVYEARQQHDVGQEREIIVQPGQKVVLTCNVGGKNGGYTWYKKGFSTYLTGSTYTINSVAAKDTGDYKTLVTNEFVRLNDANADYSSVYSSPIHVRFIPSAPGVKSVATNYSGTEVSITFTKPMASPKPGQASEFIVTSNGQPVAISDIALGGRFAEKLVLKLASPVLKGETVKVSYNQGSVVCANNGALKSFSDVSTLNLARTTPNVLNAITRDDGNGIFITFDQYVDPSTLVVSDFTVTANSNRPVSSVILKEGQIDATITKTIELVMSEPLTTSDVITVSYQRGSLSALYGSLVPTFNNLPVVNTVVENRTSVLIQVEDGTKELTGLVVKGNMKSLPFNLFDDGTNGDVVAGDHIWSKNLDLNDGNYSWAAFNRETVLSYDTVTTVSGDGTITKVITPSYKYNDLLISEGQTLDFSVTSKTVKGRTFYGYRNNKVTFILDMSGYHSSNSETEIAPYLMGIKDDWTDGLAMTLLSGNSWSISIGGLSVGEKISYNFRNGDDWENNSPLSRVYTVVGNDTIYASFGNLNTGIPGLSSQSLKVYPNPATETIYLSVSGHFNATELFVFDVYGRMLINQKQPVSSLNISMLCNGIYILRMKNSEGEIQQARFLKN